MSTDILTYIGTSHPFLEKVDSDTLDKVHSDILN